MGRKHRNARRSQVRQNKSSSNVVRAIQNLTLATQEVIPSARPDVPRMRINHRQLYTFERAYPFQATGLSPLTVGQVVFITPTLADLPNDSEFTNLFAKYRFLQVVVEFPSPSSSTSFITDSAIYYFDGAVTPSTVSALQQMDTYMSHDAANDTRITRVFTPRTLQTGAVSQVLGNKTWIATSNATVNQNGLLIAVATPMSVTVSPEMIIRCVVQFMNPY